MPPRISSLWTALLILAAALLAIPGSAEGELLGDKVFRCAGHQGLVMLRCLGFLPDTVLDLGANRGTWTRAYLELFPEAKFFMIDGTAYWKFWRALMITGQVNATVALLGSQPQPVEWYSHERFQTGNSIFKEATHWFKDVSGTPRMSHCLDTLLQQKGWPQRIDLVKMDLQGAELEVLRGAPAVLLHAQVILVEIPFAVAWNQGAPAFAEYIAFLDHAGFVPFDIAELHRGVGFLVQIDMVFVRKGSRWSEYAQKVTRKMGKCGFPGSLAKPNCLD